MSAIYPRRVGTLFELNIAADELRARLVDRRQALTSAGTSSAVSERIDVVLAQLASRNFVPLDLLWPCYLLWNNGEAEDRDVVTRTIRSMYPTQVADLCDEIDRRRREGVYRDDPAVTDARQILNWFGIPEEDARSLLFRRATYERVERVVGYVEQVAKTIPDLPDMDVLTQRLEGIRFSHTVMLAPYED